MKIVGLITEYNPFHNGHKYHLEKSKELTNAEYSVAVMSGNFLQRGEPAIVDKWTRAKMAIENNVDLVLELPTFYSCQSAEYFAYGAVKLLDSLGVVDNICFGSEYGEIDILFRIAKVILEEPNSFVSHLKTSLSDGNPFHKARSYALSEYFKNDTTVDNDLIEKVISSPNNILGIEYLKALIKINSNIKPYTIKRITNQYNQKSLSGSISSATAIRNEITNGGLSYIKEAVPNSTFDLLMNFKNEFGIFNNINNYNQILLYLIKTQGNKILEKSIVDFEKGLSNRIVKCSNSYNDINDILKCIKTKRYAYTRLQRSLMQILLGMDSDTFKNIYESGPQYIRVLGMNKKGIDLLHMIKKKAELPIITKFSKVKKYNNTLFNSMIKLDKKATDIYYLFAHNSTKNISNLDYYTSPYIKKD